jgi:hypothetical protein
VRDRATIVAASIAGLSLLVSVGAFVALKAQTASAPIAAASASPAAAPTEGEVTLGQALQMDGDLTGEHFRALLNRDLMSVEDGRLVFAIQTPSDAMIVGARDALRVEAPGPVVLTTVFDGKQGHAITLEDYDAASDSFGYSDPWGHQHSFLEAGYNAAGVNAYHDPTNPNRWRVKSAEFERVLYAISVPFGEMLQLAGLMPLGAFGSLGDTIDSAKRTDFFTFFNLEQTRASAGDKGRRLLIFQPSGPAFHSLAAVEATTDANGRLLRMQLALARRFLDDPRNAPFAHDIATSFLRDSMPTQDQGILAGLPSTFFDSDFAGSAELSRSRLDIRNVGSGNTRSMVFSLDTLAP